MLVLVLVLVLCELWLLAVEGLVCNRLPACCSHTTINHVVNPVLPVQTQELSHAQAEYTSLTNRVAELRAEEEACAPHVASLQQASEDAHALKNEMATAQAALVRIEAEADAMQRQADGARRDRDAIESTVRGWCDVSWWLVSFPCCLCGIFTFGLSFVSHLNGHAFAVSVCMLGMTAFQLSSLRQERATVDVETSRVKAELAKLQSDHAAAAERYKEQEQALRELSIVGAHVNDFGVVRARLDTEVWVCGCVWGV